MFPKIKSIIKIMYLFAYLRYVNKIIISDINSTLYMYIAKSVRLIKRHLSRLTKDVIWHRAFIRAKYRWI